MRTGTARAVLTALALALIAIIGAGTAAQRPTARDSLDEASPPTTLASSPLAAGAAISTASAIGPGTVGRATIDLAATYDVDLALRYGDRAVRVDSTATITNISGGPIDRIELNTFAARLGGMRLYRVSVDGRTVSARVDDQTIVVPLGGVLPASATVRVRVIYHATLRSTVGGSDWLFTRANGIVDLYRWIPWIARPVPFDRANHGDPFMTPVSSRVDVRLTTDRRLVVATNARRTSVSTDGKIQTFVASNVRDVPISAAPDYRVSSTRSGSTTVRVYARPGTSASGLRSAAVRAIQRMSAVLGPPPYSTYVVSESAGGWGMEGPGTTWIPRGVDPSGYPYLVAHETGHEWFPALVGNDQWADPFADEGLVDMIARWTLDQRRASRCAAGRLDRPITAYSAACYYEVIYIQGGNFLDSIRRAMGDNAYWAGIRDYIAAHRFGFGSSRELLDALDARTPIDVAARAARWFPSLY